MAIPWGLLGLALWLLGREWERGRREQEERANPTPPLPRLSLHLRVCPFCGGASEYYWAGHSNGGHRLTCGKCGEIYSSNPGGQTRWTIARPSGDELCYAFSPEDAQRFLDEVLSRVTPGAGLELRFGADESTPSLYEYFQELQRLVAAQSACQDAKN